MRGKFITVEGGEGVGKSSNLDAICERIREGGHDVLQTREPGGTPTAELIRRLLLEHGDEPLPAEAELLLFFAARSLHVSNVIRPSLEAGTWIVCDRFTDASLAYQGGGRGLDKAKIEMLAQWVHGDLRPDLTILLDAPLEVGRGRAARRGEADRMETERSEFHDRVRRSYLALAAAEPRRFAVVDASAPLDQVRAEVSLAVGRLMSEK
ncbi:MAG: dTMP kinase [Woeseia sp.]